MTRRLPYQGAGLAGMAAVGVTAIVTAAPTLWLVMIDNAAEAMALKTSNLINWGLDVARLRPHNAGGTWIWADLSRLVSYGILHVSVPHLLFNLCQLVPLWWMTARRLGVGLMVATYLIGLALSGLLHLVSATPGPITVGASGGVHVLGGLWTVWVFLDREVPWLHRIGPSLLILTFFLAQNVFLISQFGLAFAWDLHLWGFLAGMALAPYLPRRNGPRT